MEEPPLQADASLVGPLVYLGIVSRLLPEPPDINVPTHVRQFLDGHAGQRKSHRKKEK